jgi:predicted RNase H-like HicB family nuclease
MICSFVCVQKDWQLPNETHDPGAFLRRADQRVRLGQEHVRAPLANSLCDGYFHNMTCKLTAIIEQDKEGVFAYCPELKGCHTQGDTVEEALTNLREAAELYLETLKPAELRRMNAKTILATSLEIVHA